LRAQVRVKKVLFEAVLVGVLGAAVAFVANAISPRGLKLARDYFPGAVRPHSHTNLTAASAGTNTNAHWEMLAARLKEKGLQLVDVDQALKLFNDPRREQGLVVFIDARKDKEYQEGHIPGAHQFDHYRYENYLSAVLPVCQVAQQIVVYCAGGECEDSEFTATMLSNFGVSREKLFVYGGGITEWKSRTLPIELGEANSGKLINANSK
jgi:rhodanese-related sulfurtransferase